MNEAEMRAAMEALYEADPALFRRLAAEVLRPRPKPAGRPQRPLQEGLWGRIEAIRRCHDLSIAKAIELMLARGYDDSTRVVRNERGADGAWKTANQKFHKRSAETLRRQFLEANRLRETDPEFAASCDYFLRQFMKREERCGN